MHSFRQHINEAKDRPVVFTFGRFNPITWGHEVVIDTVIKRAGRRGIPMVFTSQSQDKERNPLSYRDKLMFLKRFFPKAQVMNRPDIKTAFQVLEWLSKEGYRDVTFVVGGDRVMEFRKAMTKYVDNGTYPFDKFEVVNAAKRTGASISATKMRNSVKNDDYAFFKKGLPKKAKDKDGRDMFNAVKKGMGL